jgi:hypothetical protein
MAEIRQIGKLTIHFLGDNAAQLAKSFDGSLSGSRSFGAAMDETARTQRHIYVGSSLDDLRDQPGFDRAKFNRDLEKSQSAFGKPAGADSYFIVVTNRDHHLIQNDGQTFPGSMDLSWFTSFCTHRKLCALSPRPGAFLHAIAKIVRKCVSKRLLRNLGRHPEKIFRMYFNPVPTGFGWTLPKRSRVRRYRAIPLSLLIQ